MQYLKALVLCTALVIGMPLLAHADGGACTGTECEAAGKAHRTLRTGLKPPVADMVCIYVGQYAQRKVTLVLSHERQPLREVSRFLRSNDGRSGKFCIGRWWFTNKPTDLVRICNDQHTVMLRKKHIETMLRLGRTPVGRPVCLYPEGKCQ